MRPPASPTLCRKRDRRHPGARIPRASVGPTAQPEGKSDPGLLTDPSPDPLPGATQCRSVRPIAVRPILYRSPDGGQGRIVRAFLTRSSGLLRASYTYANRETESFIGESWRGRRQQIINSYYNSDHNKILGCQQPASSTDFDVSGTSKLPLPKTDEAASLWGSTLKTSYAARWSATGLFHATHRM